MDIVPKTPDKPLDKTPLVRVQGVVSGFGDRTVLHGITLDVMRGDTMVVMGGSGCGKTTLLRHMTGTLGPDQGRVELFGQDLGALTHKGLNDLRRRFGVLYQSGALFSSMTVGQNVALPLVEHTRMNRSEIERTVMAKLELVAMADAVDLMPAELSGGMRKRAGLARAVVMDPEVLFYDEPTAGLDPITSAQISRLIRDLDTRLGVTSVVVTHDLKLAFEVADRIAVMEAGRMLKVGGKEEFAAIRDAGAPADETEAAIRQFLRGEAPENHTNPRPG